MRGLVHAIAFLSAGCAVQPDLAEAPPTPRAPTPIVARIREDFDNLLLVESSNGVVIDLNHSSASLRTERIPEVTGQGISSVVSGVNSYAAETVLLDQAADVSATDSIELLGQREVRVAGRLVAGPGGVTIAAGSAIHIDGSIVSEGPVRLLLAEPTGRVRITGSVISHAAAGPRPAISIASRGQVELSGLLSSVATDDSGGGDIEIGAYGTVEIRTGGGEIAASSLSRGAPGFVRLRSETSVRFVEGGHIGGPSRSMALAAQFPGDVEIDAPLVEVGESSYLRGGSGEGKGSSLILTATSLLELGAQAELIAGNGAIGGSVVIHALAAILGPGARVGAGNGTAQAGSVHLRVTENLALELGAMVQGGVGECGDGGAVEIEVGGSLRAAGGAEVRGGAGTTCGNATARSGAVSVLAGDGQVPAGLVEPGPQNVVRTGATLTVAPPLGSFVVSGTLVSVVIERPEALTGRVPRLLEISQAVPIFTRLCLELSGAPSAEGPFEDWVDLLGSDGRALERLASARFFRYRLRMEGRTADTPVLDFFDVDLGAE